MTELKNKNKNRNGGSACKYIKKANYCISPCKKVHNDKIKHKWYCKKTKRCSGKQRKHKNKTMKKSKSKNIVSNVQLESESESESKTELSEKPVSTIENTSVNENTENGNITSIASKAFSDFSKAASNLVNSNKSKENQAVETKVKA